MLASGASGACRRREKEEKSSVRRLVLALFGSSLRLAPIVCEIYPQLILGCGISSSLAERKNRIFSRQGMHCSQVDKEHGSSKRKRSQEIKRSHSQICFVAPSRISRLLCSPSRSLSLRHAAISCPVMLRSSYSRLHRMCCVLLLSARARRLSRHGLGRWF